MDLHCDICRKLIPEGTLYGQFTLTIEKMENYVVKVKNAKAITTLCMVCTKKYDGFEEAKQLLD